MNDKPLTGKRLAKLKAWYLHYRWLISDDDLAQAFSDEHRAQKKEMTGEGRGNP